MTTPTPTEVRALRAFLGLSQSQAVARLEGITLRTWQAWEHGTRNCPVAKWHYIRQALGESVGNPSGRTGSNGAENGGDVKPIDRPKDGA